MKSIKKTIAATALGAAAAGALAIGAGTASAAPEAPELVDPCYQVAVQVPGVIGLTPIGPAVDLIGVFHPVEVGDGWMWAEGPTGRVLLTECR